METALKIYELILLKENENTPNQVPAKKCFLTLKKLFF